MFDTPTSIVLPLLAETTGQGARVAIPQSARWPGFRDNSETSEAIVTEVLQSFRLSLDEEHQARSRLVQEVVRHWRAYLRACIVSALLPIIQVHAEGYFRRWMQTSPEAEELAADLGVKLLRSLFGNWPRGNVGAWVAAIRCNVRNDYGRQRRRRQAAFDTYVRISEPTYESSCLDDRETLERLVASLPQAERHLIERLLCGDSFPSWMVIGTSLGHGADFFSVRPAWADRSSAWAGRR
jgi:DNA-directed RNA polymerase specialized sigma24 family protein